MSYTIDTVHSHVGFSVRHMMVTTVRGQFTRYTGTAAIDAADFTKSTFQGEIEVDSIDTGNADRDKHLRTNDFFDAAKYPTAHFVSTKVTVTGDGAATIDGNLTLHGVTKPVSLDARFVGAGKGIMGSPNPNVGFAATTTIKRSDWGMGADVPLLSDTVVLTINAAFEKK